MITLAHGEGGRLSRDLIDQVMSMLGPAAAVNQDDAGRIVLPLADHSGPNVAVTTDSFVVSPLFFPGSDIGTLAVFGTANDLAVNGATPKYLTLALILEEGLPLATLSRVIAQVREAALRCEISIVAGDTKVVPRGAVDQLFINTTGVGVLDGFTPPGPQHIRDKDCILVSGPIGRHGMAVMCAREGFQLEPSPTSDCGSLAPLATQLRSGLGDGLRAMRDATRGGVAAVLHEWAAQCGLTLTVNESSIPVTNDVRGACELLGLDPLHVANEGTMVCATAPDACDEALTILRQFNEQAARIALARPQDIAPVTIQRMLGREQPLDEPLGAPLPRIC